MTLTKTSSEVGSLLLRVVPIIEALKSGRWTAHPPSMPAVTMEFALPSMRGSPQREHHEDGGTGFL